MKKPVFWNSIAIYMLLYNNISIIIALILVLKATIEGTAHFTSAVWYQLLVFLVYLLVTAGLLLGGKKGYILSALFIPFIFLVYFYPPLMVTFLPIYLMITFRIVELAAFLYLVVSPESRAYFIDCLKNK